METKIIEIQEEINKVDDKIVDAQSNIQSANTNLSSIKTSTSTERLPDKLFKKYLEAKEIYIKDRNDNLSTLRLLKTERKILLIEQSKIEREFTPINYEPIKKQLQLIKDKYFEFYTDKTRISGMRKMASNFIIDIDSVIKKM